MGEQTMQIKQLHGTEEELYRLVALLVMDPVVLKQNYNFPFRTSVRFEWLVALGEEEEVLGFLPTECKRTERVINNYYVKGKEAEILSALLTVAVKVFEDRVLAAVVFKEDVDTFRILGFTEEKAWTRYVRMRKEPKHGEKG